jgi:hypothetical protein
MYSVYLALVVASVCSFFWSRRCLRRRGDEPIMAAILGSLFAFLLICLVGVIVGEVIDSHIPGKTTERGPFKLVALRSADGVAGSFVYGSGSINGVAYYRVLVQNDDGSMSPYEVVADSTTRITESHDLQNEGTWTQTVVAKDYSTPLGNWAIGQDFDKTSNRFVVPAGSVVQSFSVR